MLDIVITSSSRPQLFPQFWETFNKMIIYRGRKRVIVHEDFVFPEESIKVVEYLNELELKGEIDEVITSNPFIGLGFALDNIIRNYVTSRFIFYTQEDWVFERPIDLDRLIWVMENNDDINLIFLKRSRNVLIEEVEIGGVPMCKFQLWSFNPGLWRVSAFRKYWKPSKTEPELHFNNNIGTREQRKNMGLYVLGRHNDYNHVKHTGYNLRMAEWLRINNKPGTHPTKEKSDLKNRAPWLLPLNNENS